MRQRNHLLELRQVTQTYRSGERQFIALQNVNLSLGEGEFVCLFRPSGCGKSTLLRIITGLQRPSEGEVLSRGKPLRESTLMQPLFFRALLFFPG